jgi:serine/threonine protein kinase
MDTSMIRWISKQIVGIAGALHTIHEPPSNSLITPQTNKYGRHGDLKPENILWYDSPSDAGGILVIADLGLSKLNSIRTRSNEAIEDLHATARYRPPECDIEGGKVSRAYDVWTFGCLLLEWLCWAMNGQADRVQFLYSLRSPYSIGAYSDVFFDLIAKESGGHQVIVKSKVIQVSPLKQAIWFDRVLTFW